MAYVCMWVGFGGQFSLSGPPQTPSIHGRRALGSHKSLFWGRLRSCVGARNFPVMVLDRWRRLRTCLAEGLLVVSINDRCGLRARPKRSAGPRRDAAID